MALIRPRDWAESNNICVAYALSALTGKPTSRWTTPLMRAIGTYNRELWPMAIHAGLRHIVSFTEDNAPNVLDFFAPNPHRVGLLVAHNGTTRHAIAYDNGLVLCGLYHRYPIPLAEHSFSTGLVCNFFSKERR